LQIPAVMGAGMGEATFGEGGAPQWWQISLDEFAQWLRTVVCAEPSTRSTASRALLKAGAAEHLMKKRDDSTPSAPTEERSIVLTDAATLLTEVLSTVKDLTGVNALTADMPLMEAGIDSLASTELASRLRSLTGLAIAPTAALEYPTPRGLATHLISQVEQGAAVDAAPQKSRDFSDTSVALGHASPLHARLHTPILFLLSFIRSGSSLLQLCLNASGDLYAGQELYLLMFDTMGERHASVGGKDYEEGLLATIMELRSCSVDEAEAFIAELGEDCPMSRMYELLQELCAPRMLVDKTPPNASQSMFLLRIPEIFASPRYLHLVRHPYAAIESGLQLQRDILGDLSKTWDGVEQDWIDTNVTTKNFLLGVTASTKLELRYEELVRSPEIWTRRICELLGIAWEPKMANPYESSATDSFQAARKFVTTDPKLLRRKKIEPALADKWREVILPKPLRSLTNMTAMTFGYELLPELDAELVWLSRTPARSPPVVFLHDFTGLLWSFDALARTLRAPCLGIQCSKRLLEGCTSMQELAWRYVRLLPPNVRRPVRLVAYSLGCRIAYRMAMALEQMGEDVQLVLLDGPVGPEHDAPPRFGGMVSTIVDQIQSRVSSQRKSTSSLATPSSDGVELTADPINALVGMVASMGEEAASVTTALLQLPDPEHAPPPPARVAALHIAAESSANRTNGTVETVKRCLPDAQQATVPGAHFDFVKQSAETIAELADSFFNKAGD